MPKDIYPNELRENSHLATLYCEMAMESYYNAFLCFNEIKESDYDIDLIDDEYTLYKSTISTIVFSAMSIEAFLNDYAAACLGDSDFYNNFDRLSVLSKFQLIAKFILKSDIDKSKAYYSYLKALIRERDSYVHSKSHSATFQGYTESEIQELHKNYTNNIMADSTPSLDSCEIKIQMHTALDALKAITSIATYFDAHDANIHAIVKLFHPYGHYPNSKKEKRYRKVIFPLLGFKEIHKNEV